MAQSDGPLTPPKRRALRKPPTDDISPDDLPAVFGRNIRLSRLRHNMTLQQLADLLGVTMQSISRIEHGQVSFGLPNMQRIAAILGRDVRDMLLPTEPSHDKK